MTTISAPDHNSGITPCIPDYGVTFEDTERPAWIEYAGMQADDFTGAALGNLKNGYGALPLGRVDDKPGKSPHKNPWRKGLHGYHGTDATPADIMDMPYDIISRICKGERGLLNLGARLPLGVIGIDVDHYGDKYGLDTIAALEDVLGPLPPTWMLTAREYESGSGIRLYRVDAQVWQWPGDSDLDDVEIIDRHHRYVCAPGSLHHTSRRYRLYHQIDGREVTSGVLPHPGEIVELPPLWAEWTRAQVNYREDGTRAALTSAKSNTRAVCAVVALHTPVADADVEAFCEEHQGNDRPKALDNLTNKLRRERKETRNKVRNFLRVAAQESRLKFYPYETAIDEIRDAAIESYEARAAEGDDRAVFDERDFDRLVINGIEQASRKTDEECLDEAERRYGTRHNDPTNTRTLEGWSLDREDESSDMDNVLKFPKDAEGSAGEKPERSVTQCLADVKPVAVRYLWKPWIPLGKVVILDGEPDVGKSTVTISWASIVSNGSRWPATVLVNGKQLVSQHDPAGVLLIGVEDSNDDTVVPRLIAAGANLNLIHSLCRPVDKDGKPKPFTIPDDIDWLRKAITETKATLVVIDPITACLPDDTRHGVDASIRRILSYLVELATEASCSIVLIRHFNKAAGMSALNRGGGSIAYSAVARSVIAAGRLIESTDEGAAFAIARTKGNLSVPPLAITYRIEDAPDLDELPEPEDDGLRTSVIRWCGTKDINADQLVGSDGAKVSDARKTAPMRDEAEAALKEILANGQPMKMGEAEAEVMRIAGCSKGTVKNAAKKMKIVKGSVRKPDGTLDYWTWRLLPKVIQKTKGTND